MRKNECRAKNEPGNVFEAVLSRSPIGLLDWPVHGGLPPAVSQVVPLRLEALLFVGKRDPTKASNNLN